MKLVPFSSQGELELRKTTFLVPANWKSCGVVMYISGSEGIENNQPVALAIAEDTISLCEDDGPRASIPILSIKEVRVVDLTGVSFSMDTPSGMVDLAPSNAKGIAITYVLNPMGTTLDLSLFTFTSKAAYEWVNIISDEIHKKSAGLGTAGKFSRR